MALLRPLGLGERVARRTPRSSVATGPSSPGGTRPAA